MAKVSYKINKLREKIDRRHILYMLVMSGKNNLPYIPKEIQDLIMNYIIDNNVFFPSFERFYGSYDSETIFIKKIKNYLCTIEQGISKKKLCIDMFTYLINNSIFVTVNNKFSEAVKRKIKELLKQHKFSNKKIDIELNNKLNETYQKIFGFKAIRYCKKCNRYQCSLKYNYNLCHAHLYEKFN